MLGEKLAALRDGRGATVLIDGRAGFGKTRLLAEASAMARSLGVRVGSGHIDASDQVVPMSALVGALFDGSEPLVDPAARRQLPYLPEQRYWLLEELESLLDAAAVRSPVLICLDDLQWADHGCLAALRTLPMRLADLPIMWLVAFRGSPVAPELRAAIESLDAIGTHTLTLSGLDSKAVAQVANDIFGAQPDGALLRIAERAGGSPFLLVELLHGLQQDSLVHIDAGQATLVENRLPSRVTESMRERLDRMSEDARRAATVASVLGRVFSFEQLAMMLNAAPALLLEPVHQLLSAELLAEDDAWLTYRHDLIREAVRDTLPISALRALQRHAVDVLMATGSPPAEVALQLAASARTGDQAAIAALREAARVLGSADPATAADLSQRAFELTLVDDPLRGPLAAETISLLHASNRVAEGKALADAVLNELLSPDQEAEILFGIADMLGLSADVRIEAGRRALKIPELSPRAREQHAARLVLDLLAAERIDEARQLLDDTRSLERETADQRTAFTLDLAEGRLEFVLGNLAKALALFETAARSPAAVNEPYRRFMAHEFRAEVLVNLDRFDESLSVARQGVSQAQRDHQQWAVRIWEGWRGRQLFQLGKLRDASAALEGVVRETGEYGPVSVFDAAAVAALGRVAIHLGDGATLQYCVEMARGLVDSDSPLVQRHAVWLLTLAAMAAGDPHDARDKLRRRDNGDSGDILPHLPLDVTDEVHLIRIARAVGDGELVQSTLTSCRNRLAGNPTVPSIAATAAHVRALATGDIDLLQDAVAEFRNSPRQLALASALEDDGTATTERGDAAGGIAKLTEALALYTELGASWDSGRVRARLRELGVIRRIASTPGPSEGWDALTRTELEVVRLVVQGLTNREAARRLYVSPHTVSTHLRHVFTKLGINSRFELIRVAAQHDRSQA